MINSNTDPLHADSVCPTCSGAEGDHDERCPDIPRKELEPAVTTVPELIKTARLLGDNEMLAQIRQSFGHPDNVCFRCGDGIEPGTKYCRACYKEME